MCSSEVPGGASTTKKSICPQSTSVRNCLIKAAKRKNKIHEDKIKKDTKTHRERTEKKRGGAYESGPTKAIETQFADAGAHRFCEVPAK